MNVHSKITAIAIFIAIGAAAGLVWAENIDPYNDGSQYAWGENVGWINFEPGSGDGVQVSSSAVQGFAWAENIGWINLSPSTYGGVTNDGTGILSGYAWGENVGWINFDPAYGGVSIDSEGYFSGYAWGENIGWINFDLTTPVQACKVCTDDLYNFIDNWLTIFGNPGEFTGDRKIDFRDFRILASYWLDYCPDSWPLK